jgi:hypothetical protein
VNKLFKGLNNSAFYIIPGVMARLTWILHRFFPALLFFIMDKDARKVQSEAGDKRQNK